MEKTFLDLFKSNLKYILLLSCVFYLSSCAVAGTSSKITGQSVPFTKFTKLDGSYIVTDEFLGKTAVVTFWASWCGYSRPVLTRLSNFAKKLNRSDVLFIAASVDKAHDFEKLKEVIDALKADAHIHCFSGNDVYDEAYMAFDAGVLPHIFIINPQGKVVEEGHKDSFVYEYFERKVR